MKINENVQHSLEVKHSCSALDKKQFGKLCKYTEKLQSSLMKELMDYVEQAVIIGTNNYSLDFPQVFNTVYERTTRPKFLYKHSLMHEELIEVASEYTLRVFRRHGYLVEFDSYGGLTVRWEGKHGHMVSTTSKESE